MTITYGKIVAVHTYSIIALLFHSSGDEGSGYNRNSSIACGAGKQCSADLSSEDEFEKEMDSEALATLKLMVSPTAAAEASKSHTIRPFPAGTADNIATRRKTKAQTRRVRQRKHSGDQRKTVRFAEAQESSAGLSNWQRVVNTE